MPADAAHLSIDGVEHRYADSTVLHAVSFQAKRGEILCLLGRSGCGKTTLLRLIAGLERPAAGTIAVNGAVLTGANAFVPPEKRGIGFMFQDYALFPHLTVFENMTFGLKGRPPQDIASAKTLLARVGLESFSNRYPHTLSAGEQQRAALVRALAPRPAILLMDEPFSNLDARTRDGVRDMALELLRETQTPAVIVTHDPAEAMRIGDRIVLMQSGRVMQIGTPTDIYQRPASLYAARYFSDLNEIEGVCRDGTVTTPLGQFVAPTLDPGACIAGIRPTALRPGAAGEGSPARVIGVTFLGDTTQITLKSDAVATPLKAAVHGTTSYVPDQVVGLTFATHDVLFFPKDGVTDAP